MNHLIHRRLEELTMLIIIAITVLFVRKFTIIINHTVILIIISSIMMLVDLPSSVLVVLPILTYLYWYHHPYHFHIPTIQFCCIQCLISFILILIDLPIYDDIGGYDSIIQVIPLVILVLYGPLLIANYYNIYYHR